MVSALVTRGYITRDSHLIQSQPWTMDLDGPATPSLGELLERSSRVLQQTATIKKASRHRQRGRTGKVMAAGGLQSASAASVKVSGSGGVVKVDAKKGKESQARTMMRWAASVGNQGGMHDWDNLSWGKVYDTVDAKGVPQLQLMERKMGKDKPELREGMGLWGFIDTLAVDLMMLSRAESTWKQYAAWYSLFEEWGSIMGVDVAAASVSLEMLSRVLIRSLVMMWLGGGYAASTMEIYTTAVVTRVRDRGLGELRDNVAIGKLMEGIKRKLGCAVTKKLPVEGHHVRALMAMGPPEKDGECWTGSAENIGLQWMQTVAMVVLAWAAFLRCGEIMNLQLCDLTWVKHRMELCIRKAKADQLGLTAVTEIEYASAGSERCLLTYFESYLRTVLGGVTIDSGCTKGDHKSYECPACGWVFPGVMCRGVVKQLQAIKECSLRKRFKAALENHVRVRFPSGQR